MVKASSEFESAGAAVVDGSERLRSEQIASEHCRSSFFLRCTSPASFGSKVN